MSQENVEIVRRAGEAWQEGGPDAMLEFFAPDIEWRVRPDLPDAATYRGHDGVRQLFASFEELFEQQGYGPREFIDAGDLVVMSLHWWARGRGSGVTVAERGGETWVFKLRNGKIAAVHEYQRKDEALRAVGVSE